MWTNHNRPVCHFACFIFLYNRREWINLINDYHQSISNSLLCFRIYNYLYFFQCNYDFKKNTMPIDLSYELVLLVLFQHLIFSACINFCGCRSYCFWTFFGLLYCFPGTNFNMFSINYVHYLGLTFLFTSYLYTEWMYTCLINTLVFYTYLLHVDTLNACIHAYLLR